MPIGFAEEGQRPDALDGQRPMIDKQNEQAAIKIDWDKEIAWTMGEHRPVNIYYREDDVQYIKRIIPARRDGIRIDTFRVDIDSDGEAKTTFVPQKSGNCRPKYNTPEANATKVVDIKTLTVNVLTGIDSKYDIETLGDEQLESIAGQFYHQSKVMSTYKYDGFTAESENDLTHSKSSIEGMINGIKIADIDETAKQKIIDRILYLHFFDLAKESSESFNQNFGQEIVQSQSQLEKMYDDVQSDEFQRQVAQMPEDKLEPLAGDYLQGMWMIDSQGADGHLNLENKYSWDNIQDRLDIFETEAQKTAYLYEIVQEVDMLEVHYSMDAGVKLTNDVDLVRETEPAKLQKIVRNYIIGQYYAAQRLKEYGVEESYSAIEEYQKRLKGLIGVIDLQTPEQFKAWMLSGEREVPDPAPIGDPTAFGERYTITITAINDQIKGIGNDLVDISKKIENEIYWRDRKDQSVKMRFHLNFSHILNPVQFGVSFNTQDPRTKEEEELHIAGLTELITEGPRSALFDMKMIQLGEIDLDSGWSSFMFDVERYHGYVDMGVMLIASIAYAPAGLAVSMYLGADSMTEGIKNQNPGQIAFGVLMMTPGLGHVARIASPGTKIAQAAGLLEYGSAAVFTGTMGHDIINTVYMAERSFYTTEDYVRIGSNVAGALAMPLGVRESKTKSANKADKPFEIISQEEVNRIISENEGKGNDMKGGVAKREVDGQIKDIEVRNNGSKDGEMADKTITVDINDAKTIYIVKHVRKHVLGMSEHRTARIGKFWKKTAVGRLMDKFMIDLHKTFGLEATEFKNNPKEIIDLYPELKKAVDYGWITEREVAISIEKNIPLIEESRLWIELYKKYKPQELGEAKYANELTDIQKNNLMDFYLDIQKSMIEGFKEGKNVAVSEMTRGHEENNHIHVFTKVKGEGEGYNILELEIKPKNNGEFEFISLHFKVDRGHSAKFNYSGYPCRYVNKEIRLDSQRRYMFANKDQYYLINAIDKNPYYFQEIMMYAGE